jgi:hypothetical protein
MVRPIGEASIRNDQGRIMTAVPFRAVPIQNRRVSQSQLRTVIGLALLSLTLGTQLIWSLAGH